MEIFQVTNATHEIQVRIKKSLETGPLARSTALLSTFRPALQEMLDNNISGVRGKSLEWLQFLLALMANLDSSLMDSGSASKSGGSTKLDDPYRQHNLTNRMSSFLMMKTCKFRAHV